MRYKTIFIGGMDGVIEALAMADRAARMETSQL